MRTGPTISLERAQEYEFQNEYIKSQEMIVIDFIGGDPATRTAARLPSRKPTRTSQQCSSNSITPTAEEYANFSPELNVIYTPNLKAEGFPSNRLISVDSKNKVTRVFNSITSERVKKAGSACGISLSRTWY